MRVLVHGAAGGLYGGIESFLLNMNEHMSGECVFDYVIIGDTCRHTDRVNRSGGKVYLVTSYRRNPFKFLWESWRTAKTLRNDHEVAYFQLFSMCHIAPILISKRLGYRIVLHAHNNAAPNQSRLYRLLHRLNRRLLSGLNCLRLTNSEGSGEFMFGRKFRGENRVALIYNAVEVEKFRFNAEVRRKKRIALAVGEQTVIGFAGRLVRQKNVSFLLDIFKEIHRRDENTVLLIVGEGEQRPDIERQIGALGLHDRVKLLGQRDDLPELYQAMDAFVLPSLAEGLGIVLVEAQAAGLACFASAAVVPELVRISPGSLGFIPLAAPAEQWAEQILAGIAAPLDRLLQNQIVLASRFNLNEEAMRLEGILKVMAQ